MHWNKLTEANTVLLKEILPGSSVKFIIGGSGNFDCCFSLAKLFFGISLLTNCVYFFSSRIGKNNFSQASFGQLRSGKENLPSCAQQRGIFKPVRDRTAV